MKAKVLKTALMNAALGKVIENVQGQMPKGQGNPKFEAQEKSSVRLFPPFPAFLVGGGGRVQKDHAHNLQNRLYVRIARFPKKFRR
jgi:hypothetical protein